VIAAGSLLDFADLLPYPVAATDDPEAAPANI
jgi:hypothetical protein